MSEFFKSGFKRLLNFKPRTGFDPTYFRIEEEFGK